MRPIHISSEAVIALFDKTPTFTMPELMVALHCSHMTVFRKLRELYYFSSYSHMGKYYTLARVARFNNNGLWEYQGIRFSLYGNLKSTVRQFVNGSQAGYSADELEKLLAVRVNNTLFDLVSEKQIDRDFYGRKYIYYSGDEPIRIQQKENRGKILSDQIARRSVPQDQKTRLPDEREVIRILVFMINHPDCDPKLIAKNLQQSGKPIDEAAVSAVFQHYDLLKKKIR